MSVFSLRLTPGVDLLEGICSFVTERDLQATFILTCVGSLVTAHLRLANQPLTTEFKGHFEIVSLVGTISRGGLAHVHISLSDGAGVTVGGHVMPGCIVYTTAEIVLGEATAMVFERPIDPATTYDELVPSMRLT